MELLSPAKKRLLEICVFLITALQIMDATITMVALPAMRVGLSTTISQSTWISTTYLVALGVVLPLSGWLSANFGIRRVLLVATVGFALASLYCGLAHDLQSLLVGRLLQGALGAVFIPMSQTLMVTMYPGEKQSKALARWGVVTMAAPMIAPVLGAFIADYAGWRWIFFINIPLGCMAFVGLLVSLPTGNAAPRRLDYRGFALFTAAVLAIQLALDRGQLERWFSSALVLYSTIVFLVSSVLFIVLRQTEKEPYLSKSLLSDRNYRLSVVLSILTGVLLFAPLTLIPQLLALLDYSVRDIGLLLAPRGLMSMIAILATPRLLKLFKPSFLIFLGASITVASTWWMSFTEPASTAPYFVAVALLQGLGLGFISIPLTVLSFSTIQPELRAEGAGFFNLSRNIGGAIGIALAQTALTYQLQSIRKDSLEATIMAFDVAFSVTAIVSLLLLIIAAISSMAGVSARSSKTADSQASIIR